MGRKLRRVPLDFDWPLNKVWEGFLMSAEVSGHDCEACYGSGSSPEGRHLLNLWYGYVPFKPEDNGRPPLTPDHPKVRAFAERNVALAPEYYGTSPSWRIAEDVYRDARLADFHENRTEAAISREARRLADLWNGQWSHHLNQTEVDYLVDGDRLYDLTRKWVDGRWEPTGHRPTAQEVNDWSIGGMGHDSINQWIVCGGVLDARGLPRCCAVCEGEGTIYDSAEHKTAHDDWEPSEPPQGIGYQMWETVSEGSPISPVFETPEALAKWLSISRPDDGSYEQWLKMIDAGWAPSMMTIDGELLSGVEAMARENYYDE